MAVGGGGGARGAVVVGVCGARCLWFFLEFDVVCVWAARFWARLIWSRILLRRRAGGILYGPAAGLVNGALVRDIRKWTKLRSQLRWAGHTKPRVSSSFDTFSTGAISAPSSLVSKSSAFGAGCVCFVEAALLVFARLLLALFFFLLPFFLLLLDTAGPGHYHKALFPH